MPGPHISLQHLICHVTDSMLHSILTAVCLIPYGRANEAQFTDK